MLQASMFRVRHKTNANTDTDVLGSEPALPGSARPRLGGRPPVGAITKQLKDSSFTYTSLFRNIMLQSCRRSTLFFRPLKILTPAVIGADLFLLGPIQAREGGSGEREHFVLVTGTILVAAFISDGFSAAKQQNNLAIPV